MTITKTQWAVCYCRDGLHTPTDHESWQDSPNSPHRTITFYEPLAHMLTQELTSTVTVAEYGPATPEALNANTADGVLQLDPTETNVLRVRPAAERKAMLAEIALVLAGGAR